jgi:hypothetical protein
MIFPAYGATTFAQVMAVCDLDAKRAEMGKKLVNDYYTKTKRGAI